MENNKDKCFIKVYEKKPADFFASFNVSGIYLKACGKLLLLKRGPHKTEAGTWGFPGGKLEANEGPLKAAKRELLEEAGVDMLLERNFQSIGQLYFSHVNGDYVYHIFTVNLKIRPFITLSNEHVSYTWVSRNKAEDLPLMLGAKEVLEFYDQHGK